MIAAAISAGVEPEQDGMEVVMTAARRTRELSKKTKPLPALDALTPGYSLIDAVEKSFRDAIVKALGGTLPSQSQSEKLQDNIDFSYDIDPELFRRRFPPNGSLRIGLTDKRELFSKFPPPSPLSSILSAYRYVDTFRNVEDVVAACMLSSYIPGVTGPLFANDAPYKQLFSASNETISAETNDAAKRAGRQLAEMDRLGFVKNGSTGISMTQSETESTNEEVQYWDGGIADLFPTFDQETVIVSPISGIYSNPSICPSMQQKKEVEETPVASNFLNCLPTLPDTFSHCPKSDLGLNVENAKALKKMIISSDDNELYDKFRDGYDDANRFLQERDLIREFRV